MRRVGNTRADGNVEINSPFILRLVLQLPGGVLSGMPVCMPQMQEPVMHASNRSDWISLPLISFLAAAEILGLEPSLDTSDRTTAYKYRRGHG